MTEKQMKKKVGKEIGFLVGGQPTWGTVERVVNHPIVGLAYIVDGKSVYPHNVYSD